MQSSISPLNEKSNTELSAYEILQERYECDHEETEIRYKMAINDVKHYTKQCLACGRMVGTSISHDKIDFEAEPWDTSFEEEDQARSKAYYDLKKLEQQQWHLDYEEYLQSDIWKSKRKRALERDKHICQACLRRPAVQVHHTTYQYEWGQEPLFVLFSVCRIYHKALHNHNVDNGEADNE